MTTMPDGVSAMFARISELRAAPAAVSEIKARFASNLSSAVAAATATSSSATGTATTGISQRESAGVANAASTATAASTSTTSTTGASTNVTAGPSTGVGGTGATPAAPSAPATGAWTDRLPDAGKPWSGQIAASAQKYGLDPEFLGGVIWTESDFNPQAVSPDGAIGMGQLMPETAQWLGVDPYNPAQNIDGAAHYYRNLVDRFGSLDLATAAYFAGPTAVKNAGGIPSDRAASYVSKVLGRRDFLAGTSATAP